MRCIACSEVGKVMGREGKMVKICIFCTPNIIDYNMNIGGLGEAKGVMQPIIHSLALPRGTGVHTF